MLKTKYNILFGVVTIGILYSAWEIARPVEIVDVH
ncbi:hypothetical protein YPPY103_4714, partial [Yersinia pestis PY-103]